MKYWVYIKDKVEGPFDEDKLVTLNGFTPDTLLCSEDAANSGNQEWVKASAIFEFEQPAPAVAPAPAPVPAPAPAPTAGTVKAAPAPETENMLAATLLAKLDAMNDQLSGLQNRIDGMQDELEKTIVTQQKAFQEVIDRTDAMEERMNTLSGQPFVAPKEESDIALPKQEKPVSHGPVSAVSLSRPTEKTADNLEDALAPIDLDKGGEEQVGFDLNPTQEEVPDEKENTFQDLLTPAQAEQLAKQSGENTPAAAEPVVEPDAKSKEDLLASLSSEEPKQDVLDQVIKEKEEDEAKKSKTLRWLSAAGAAALAGTASLVGLKNKKANAPTQEPEGNQAKAEEGAPAEVGAQPEQMQETAEQQAPETQPAPESLQLVGEQPVQDAPAGVPSLEDIPSGAQTQAPAAQDEQAGQEIAGIDEQVSPVQQPAPAEQTIQELAPQAVTNEPEVKAADLITPEDLQAAFDEKQSSGDQSVDQMLSVAPESQAQESAAQGEASLSDVSSNEPAEKAMPEGNPNDLTEIELKEGSTYLISDFVPPSSADAIPDALNQMQAAPASQNEDLNVQEMVADLKQADPVVKEKGNEEQVPASAQAILENTIKAKRGAALDIKTVPMVPEPAQSDRLHIEGMDDINTQHDIKSADVEPAGKGAKMVVGLFVILILASAIYGMLAFMEIIPPQFNLLHKIQAVANASQQDSKLNEMLGPAEEQAAPAAAQPVPEEVAAPVATSQEAVLEEVQNYLLPNGAPLKSFIEMKHPEAIPLITWEISTAVDPDNYSILVKVPPENPQSFKISYRFNYNAITKVLDPTISDAKNLLDSAAAPAN